jgi:hypothetical protein
MWGGGMPSAGCDATFLPAASATEGAIVCDGVRTGAPIQPNSAAAHLKKREAHSPLALVRGGGMPSACCDATFLQVSAAEGGITCGVRAGPPIQLSFSSCLLKSEKYPCH